MTIAVIEGDLPARELDQLKQEAGRLMEYRDRGVSIAVIQGDLPARELDQLKQEAGRSMEHREGGVASPASKIRWPCCPSVFSCHRMYTNLAPALSASDLHADSDPDQSIRVDF